MSESWPPVKKHGRLNRKKRSTPTLLHSFDLNRGDEYKPSRVGFADKDSVMNLGMKVRKRHFTTIIEALNKMVPGVTFKVKSDGKS